MSSVHGVLVDNILVRREDDVVHQVAHLLAELLVRDIEMLLGLEQNFHFGVEAYETLLDRFVGFGLVGDFRGEFVHLALVWRPIRFKISTKLERSVYNNQHVRAYSFALIHDCAYKSFSSSTAVSKSLRTSGPTSFSMAPP